jgi:hypothetical protein
MKYSPEQLQDKLFELAHKCFKADEAYVEAKEAFKILKDTKKIRFEQLVELQSGDKINHREHLARISQEWQEFLDTYAKFRYEEQRARLMRDKHRRDWETCRSLLSAIKQEMNTFTR